VLDRVSSPHGAADPLADIHGGPVAPVCDVGALCADAFCACSQNGRVITATIGNRQRLRLSDVTRKSHLDGARGVAACVVFFGHLSLALTKAIWLFNGNAAVCIFFVLSGYVLSDLVQRSPLSFPAHAVRRYTRLVGPMLITSTLAWALLALGAYQNVEAAAITGSDWLASWYKFAPSFPDMILETVYGVFTSGESRYNCNLWTMRPELIGSLYVFVLGAAVSSRRGRTICYLVLGAAYWSDYVLLFPVGALLYEFEAEIVSLMRWTSIKAMLTAIGLFFCIATEKMLATLHFPQVDMVRLHMFAAVLIVLCVLTWEFLQSILSSAFGRWLGRISFTLYLIHVPIICSLTSWLMLTLPARLMLGGTAAITIVTVLGLSTLTYIFVDEVPTRASRAIGYGFQRLLESRRESQMTAAH
jgi:peptidoglycan/LPS O-acetylase OafA/YrhL